GRGAGADRPGGAPGSALAPFDGPARAAAQLRVERLARQGLRVLAVARRSLDHPPQDLPGAVEELTLLGFVALADLPRPAARPLVRQLTAAGIRTVMLTGDHPVTARAVAGRLGIPDRRVVTGAELAALDEAGRRRLVGRAEVFARVSPEQKVHVVDALRKAGRVVAMTGDGVNDAAAIRLADVGIGIAARGSASARTAADLVLARPDVSLVVDALVEGRAMWSRVRDAVAILVGGNAGEVAFTLLGTALSGRAPLGTRQFLLVNLLTDMFPAMAVALSPRRGFRRARGGARPEPSLAAGRPALGRPLLATVGIRGAATAAGTTAAWLSGRLTGGSRRASSMALATLVATQLGQTLLVGGRSPLVVATVVGTGAALTAIVQVPGVSHFFGCTPLDPLAWATVLSCAAAATVAAAVLPPLVRRVGGRARGPLPAWLAAFGKVPVAAGPRSPSPAGAVAAGAPTWADGTWADGT
ncbi:MAG TPA: cation-translocating P-type ATPase, partial [Frankiaceae bacterium]|nr:cation-translocating P-type ATPase [Frankiaceae bacterium]